MNGTDVGALVTAVAGLVAALASFIKSHTVVSSVEDKVKSVLSDKGYVSISAPTTVAKVIADVPAVATDAEKVVKALQDALASLTPTTPVATAPVVVSPSAQS